MRDLESTQHRAPPADIDGVQIEAPELGPIGRADLTIAYTMSGVLYCGDNLEILDEYIPTESVDLIYLDPPFNSQRMYNVVYKDSRAQDKAFKDCWSWEEAASTYVQYIAEAPLKLRSILKCLHEQLIDNDSELLAYLTMMAPRLAALHRTLKPTGSLYLHCDPTASHYLKIILDALFGPENFFSEIVWKRYGAHGNSSRYGAIHDVILFYGKTRESPFNKQFVPYTEEYAESRFRHMDKDGRRYQEQNLSNPSYRPNLIYPYTASNGITYQPHKNGWKCDIDRMRQLDREGRLHFPKLANGRLRMKMYLDECEGVPVQDLWTDIDLPSTSKERVGWPTQKPVGLLKRIILSSSSAGSVVLDPFCGCGTTIVACETLGRQWIGIDIARKAVDILETRFALESLPEPSILWYPADSEAAAALAERDPDQFEAWVRRKLRSEKRRNDRGIDGECFYKDDDRKSWHVIISVKGGHGLNPGMVRDLRGTLARENAPIGVLVCMYEPTDGMRLEATRAGFLPVSDVAGPIPCIQIVTVDQLFNERRPIRAPGENSTPKPAPRLPHRGQTAMLFPSITKGRPAQEASAKAKAERKPAPQSGPSLPTRAVASGDSPSKPPSKPPPSSRR